MIYGVVLAGGRSSRMGRDKRWLEFEGRTLLEHGQRTLENSGVERVLLSGDVPGYECIPDPEPDGGPPGAVYAVVEHLMARDGGGDGLLVIPVDMPALEASVLRPLVSRLEAGAAAVHYEGEVFPCAFRLDEALRDFLRTGIRAQARLENGRRRFSMKALLRGLEAATLPTDGIAPETFRNMNTPEDWQHFLQSRGQMEGPT